jgi:Cu/Ag efflux pump CusA
MPVITSFVAALPFGAVITLIVFVLIFAYEELESRVLVPLTKPP